MIIEKINIISFGKLSDFSIDLSGGINIIEGKNESGKSTICEFIKFIFYGLPQSNEEKERLVSWNTGICKGSLMISEGEAHYRIEREALPVKTADGKISYKERSAVYDESTGKQIYKNEVPGESFFGIPRGVFESTAFVGQIDGTHSGGKSLADAAENILFSADENINTKKALKKLDEARVFLYHKNRKGGKIYECIKERDAYNDELLQAQEANAKIISLEGSLRSLTEAREKTKSDISKISDELSVYELYMIKKDMQKLDAEKAKSRKAEETLYSLMAKSRYPSPDMTDVQFIELMQKESREYDAFERDLKNAKNNVSSTTAKLRDMNEKLDKLQHIGKNETREKREAFIKKIHEKKKRSDNLKKVSVLLIIAAAILAAASVLMLILKSGMWFIPAAGTIILLLSSFFSFIQMNKTKKHVLSGCRTFGCDSYDELTELLSVSENSKAAISVIEESLRDAVACEKDSQSRLEKKKEKIVAFLCESSFNVTGNITDDIEKAIKEARISVEKLSETSREKKEADARAKDIEARLLEHTPEERSSAKNAVFDEEKMESFDYPAKKKLLELCKSQIESQTERIHGIEIELSALHATVKNPAEIAQKISNLENIIVKLNEKFEAYMLAMESIEKASSSLRDAVSPKIAETAGQIMDNLSEGKYKKLFLDSDFAISYSDAGITRDISSLSAGTSDIAYISLRIALADVLCKKALPPFIFDESFTRLDNTRLLNALSLLGNVFKGNYQAVILTCHNREKSMIKDISSANFLSI
ncbi:MAG: ATP-binding protein [Eubacteriales bacterium]